MIKKVFRVLKVFKVFGVPEKPEIFGVFGVLPVPVPVSSTLPLELFISLRKKPLSTPSLKLRYMRS